MNTAKDLLNMILTEVIESEAMAKHEMLLVGDPMFLEDGRPNAVLIENIQPEDEPEK